MENYNWSEFTQKIHIDAPKQTIYHAWTIPAELEKWFLRSAVFTKQNGDNRYANEPINEGDTYEWMWHGHADTTLEKGTVKEANGLDKLQFSFVNDSALVTVHIGEVAGKTMVMLKQENIPTDEHGKVHYHMGCQTGWTFFLTNLKSVLEGGLDLRNKDTNLAGVVNS